MDQPIIVNLQNKTVRQGLDIILSNGHGYSWRLRNGILDITNSRGSKRADKQLNMVIPVFKIADGATARMASVTLCWSPQRYNENALMTQARTLSGQHAPAMPRSNDKQRIIEHYDIVSSYYRSRWGEHLHHGYWIRGDESKEKAQLQLVEHLAELANIKPSSDILDIGCGFGASSLYLAKHYNATVTGITISPVQVEMAIQAAAVEQVDAKFLLMDAEAMNFQKQFDVLWSVESIAHYQNRQEFFASATKLLKPGGSFAITDWFKKENLTRAETRKFIDPIEKGMLVELQVMNDYEQFLISNRLQILHREVLNKNCSKTWDLSLDIIKDKSFWALAAKYGPQFVSYLKAFQAIRVGFASGNFVYGLFIASAILDA